MGWDSMQISQVADGDKSSSQPSDSSAALRPEDAAADVAVDPQIDEIIAAWPTLAPAVRAKVLAIVRGAPRRSKNMKAVPAVVAAHPNKQDTRAVAEDLRRRRPR
jgi:hypothetical protein